MKVKRISDEEIVVTVTPSEVREAFETREAYLRFRVKLLGLCSLAERRLDFDYDSERT